MVEISKTLSEQEKVVRRIYENYPVQLVVLAQRAVFLPDMWAEGMLTEPGFEASLGEKFNELKQELMRLKANGATLIGMSRTWYYFSHEQQSMPLPFPVGATYESIEAEESLAIANFREALDMLKGLADAEKDKLLMLAARGTNPYVWLIPKDQSQSPELAKIAGVPAYLGVQFQNGKYPMFSTVLETFTDLVYTTIGENPKIREIEMIVVTNQN